MGLKMWREVLKEIELPERTLSPAELSMLNFPRMKFGQRGVEGRTLGITKLLGTE